MRRLVGETVKRLRLARGLTQALGAGVRELVVAAP